MLVEALVAKLAVEALHEPDAGQVAHRSVDGQRNHRLF
jgi:hypothetical protein